VYSYFCDKKISRSLSIVDGIEVLRCSSGLRAAQFISHWINYAGENLKGSTATARACLMGACLIDAGGL
ncbi:MAG: hypothetical protein WCB15_25670, partial [Desulfobacterales bacterium]